MSTRVKFSLLLVLFALAAILAYPREDLILKRLGFKNAKLGVKLGLDLQGGAHLVYQADFSKAGNINRNEAMNNLVEVIQKRMNPTGTSEIGVTVASGDRVIVELPGVKDVTQATALLGKTAELRFVEVPSGAISAEQFIETGISGKDIDRADPDYDTQKNEPIVRLRLKNGDATQRFAEVTTRINQNGNRLLTLLDQDIVFGPATVSSPITDGTAQLQGNFTVTQAKSTAELINGGALPVPISLVEQRTVGPTLGRESVSRSLVAGLIGLGIVALFMLAYYRLAGLIAVSALVYYTALTAMLYKLSTLTPYTIVLTLAGIAGFILSIGMAVDANILIFERMKEEQDGATNFSVSCVAFGTNTIDSVDFESLELHPSRSRVANSGRQT